MNVATWTVLAVVGLIIGIVIGTIGSALGFTRSEILLAVLVVAVGGLVAWNRRRL